MSSKGNSKLGDLPRFPATRMLVWQYGRSPTTWLFFVSLGVLVVLFGHQMATAISETGRIVLNLAMFGLFTAGIGFLLGGLWSGLIDDAKEHF
jgi:hypothetical protein